MRNRYTKLANRKFYILGGLFKERDTPIPPKPTITINTWGDLKKYGITWDYLKTNNITWDKLKEGIEIDG